MLDKRLPFMGIVLSMLIGCADPNDHYVPMSSQEPQDYKRCGDLALSAYHESGGGVNGVGVGIAAGGVVGGALGGLVQGSTTSMTYLDVKPMVEHCMMKLGYQIAQK